MTVPNAIAGRKGFQTVPLAERFWAKVQKGEGCWLWIGGRRSPDANHAYGTIWVNGGNRPASKVAWELANGQPFPEGMDALHSCDNPPCVNPAHIRPGTPRDNELDAIARGRHRWVRATHCRRGHEFTPENTRWSHERLRLRRKCRTCLRMTEAKRASHV